MAEKKKDDRTRNWTFIVYPDSAPENWIEILREEQVPFIISPLHDKDVNADGEIKKAHWHVMVLFKGNKSFNQIKEITDKLNAPVPQKVNDTKAMARYFLHLDNPEKIQYDKRDLRVYGGIDIEKYLTSVSEQKDERYRGIREMCQFVDENGIVEFSDLMSYAMIHREDWFALLCDNSAYVVGLYIKSRRHKMKTEFE